MYIHIIPKVMENLFYKAAIKRTIANHGCRQIHTHTFSFASYLRSK